MGAGQLCDADIPTVRLLAETLAELDVCKKDMQENGLTQINGNSGVESSRPCVRQANLLTARIMQLYGKFGFSPKDRELQGSSSGPAADHPAKIQHRKRA